MTIFIIVMGKIIESMDIGTATATATATIQPPQQMNVSAISWKTKDYGNIFPNPIYNAIFKENSNYLVG